MKVWAYEFFCEKSIYEMETTLNEVGPWEWRVRDCDWYPDFLQCNLDREIRICIYKEGSVYRCLVESRSKSDVECSSIDSILFSSMNKLSIKNLTPKGLFLEEIKSFEWPFD